MLLISPILLFMYFSKEALHLINAENILFRSLDIASPGTSLIRYLIRPNLTCGHPGPTTVANYNRICEANLLRPTQPKSVIETFALLLLSGCQMTFQVYLRQWQCVSGAGSICPGCFTADFWKWKKAKENADEMLGVLSFCRMSP